MSEKILRVRADLWRWVKHYMYGMFAKSWNGAINGVYGFVGVATGAALNPQAIQAPNWEMAAYVFGVSFAISAIGFFKDHPLPADLGTAPPFPADHPESAREIIEEARRSTPI